MFILRSIVIAILAVAIVAIPIAEVLADVSGCVNDPTAARAMQYGARPRAYVGCWLAIPCVFQVAMHRLDVGGKGRRGKCSLVHHRLSDRVCDASLVSVRPRIARYLVKMR